MKKLLLAGMALAFFGAPLFSTIKYSTNPDECVDGVCFVPQYADDGHENYAIVSPVGYQPIENFYLKANFNTDEGKKTDATNKSKKQPTASKKPKQPKRPLTPKKK